ncbi:MAG: DUF47 domain-containing protein [Dehalococcoidia bacterium]|nr:DUF47 domain-containing protein [Dehalococcoidia bacterium]
MFKLFKFSLVPREKRFAAFFEQGAQNAVKTAQQLKDLVYVWEDVKERVQMIGELERQGDAITHQIMAQLHASFITPFDREDIALLANSLDDVTDYINAASDAMLLYNVAQPTEKSKAMVTTLVQAVTEVEKAIAEISGHINRDQLLRRCVEINRLENVGDGLYRAAMAELFANSLEAAYLIKWREIYDRIECAVDSCEDVANVLEGMALKYA